MFVCGLVALLNCVIRLLGREVGEGRIGKGEDKGSVGEKKGRGGEA